jgi:hypothetical protein
MESEKPKKVKSLLREHIQEKEYIWRTLVQRTGMLKELAKQDEHTFLFRLAERIDKHSGMEELYRNLLRKRSSQLGNMAAIQEQRFSPLERNAIPITERLIAGLDKTWFKLN